MSDYKQLVKIMFNSWIKTHELSARIVDAQIRRNNIKRLEGNYRRFLHEITSRYGPSEQIDEGLIRYYHNLAEAQYRSILLLNHGLASKSFKLNPFPLRKHKQKIDFSDFACEPSK